MLHSFTFHFVYQFYSKSFAYWILEEPRMYSWFFSFRKMREKKEDKVIIERKVY